MVENRYCRYFGREDMLEQERLISEQGFLLENKITLTVVWKHKAEGHRVICDF